MQDFGDPEGLDDIVLVAGSQPGHQVVQGVAGGQEEQRGPVHRRAASAASEALRVRQRGVPDDEVVPVLGDPCRPLDAGIGCGDAVSGQLHGGGEEFGDNGIVGDQQDVLVRRLAATSVSP